MKVNIAISAKANILAAINAANVASSTNITEAQVTFGVATAAAGTAGRNTTVQLTGIDGQGIEGSRTFSYTRQPLSGGAIPTDAPAFVSILQADTRPQVLAKVITALGLLAAEIEDLSYTAPVDISTPGTMQIAAVANSYLYYDLLDVEIRLADLDVAFATIAPITDLDAFEAED